jgi:hypothetical protein
MNEREEIASKRAVIMNILTQENDSGHVWFVEHGGLDAEDAWSVEVHSLSAPHRVLVFQYLANESRFQVSQIHSFEDANESRSEKIYSIDSESKKGLLSLRQLVAWLFHDEADHL